MNEDRTKKAAVTLFIGLGLNIALGAAKLATGLMSGSASVTSDAVNNLSDAAVSVMTIVATFLAARGADHKHPFGHGRYEYIATFVLGAVIIAVGAEVLLGGVRRIVEPVDVEFDIAVLATLAASIAVKAFMAVFYTVHGRRVGSDAIKAAAVDSASDCAVTAVVLGGALVEKFTGVHIDGYASVAVAVVILVFAIKILVRTISRLLGERPDAALHGSVVDIIESFPEVMSVHDLIINDYGANNMIAEADAVFDSAMSFADVHAVCDAAEKQVLARTGIKICIHADPLDAADGRLGIVENAVNGALEAYGASAHDVEIDDASKTVSLDIKISDDKSPTAEIVAQAEAAVRSELQYEVKIRVDYI